MESRNDDPLAVPRGELDAALAQVMDSARAALAAQDRLRSLLKATQTIAEELDLATVLQRIVDAAVHLVGAEYGALGVVDAAHSGLEQFIYEGISEQKAAEIGHLPEGHGLLGALIVDPRPIRLTHLADDPRSSGFPAHHPPMDSFLGVPIRVRGEVFGNLYLTNQRESGTFSAEDEQFVKALAVTAGFAIENARLYWETQHRQRWSAATAEITAALLSADCEDPIALIAEKVLAVSNAVHVRIVVPTDDGDRLTIHTARGADAEVEGQSVPRASSVSGSVLASGKPRLLTADDAAELQPPMSEEGAAGSIVAAPLVAEEHVQGTLVVVRAAGSRPFTPVDVEMISDFAGQVALAMRLAEARAAQQRMLLYDDRSRIARDLHDHVIQQLFASGLELQSLAGVLEAREAARVEGVITSLDTAITQIRTVIFALSSPQSRQQSSIRHQVIDLIAGFDSAFERTPTVTFTGPVDLAISGRLATEVLAVVREGLANAAKHAGGTTASVHVSATGGEVLVEVHDDGHGYRPGGRRSGLANLEERATSLGGAFTVESAKPGTRLRWRVPLSVVEGAADDR